MHRRVPFSEVVFDLNVRLRAQPFRLRTPAASSPNTVTLQIGDDPIDSIKLDLADAIGDLFDRLLSFLFLPTWLCRVGIGLFVAE